MKVVRTTTDLGSTNLSVIDPDGAAQLVVPGVRFLLEADYARHGDDLLLTGDDGAQVLVTGYFALAAPPVLVTSNGWQVAPELVSDLAKSASQGLYAQQTAQALGQSIGRVEATW